MSMEVPLVGFTSKTAAADEKDKAESAVAGSVPAPEPESQDSQNSDELPVVHVVRPAPGWLESFKEIMLGSRVNILLVAVPFALLAEWTHWGNGAVFFLCFIGLVPLANMLGNITEELARHTNETIGGLLNATFGNATEVIISIFALRANLLHLVQVSLLGSILSNCLLVLGCSFLAGGLKHKEQEFNKQAAATSSGLLLLATLSITVPAAMVATGVSYDAGEHVGPDAYLSDPAIIVLSRVIAILQLSLYLLFLYFQLRTHTYMYEGMDEDDEEEGGVLSFWGALGWLAVLTVLIALLSEYLVGAIEPVSEEFGISQSFIGMILVPIVGNAAEHASAVTVAYKNKMDLSLGVAIGSSTQIAVGVIPVMVLVAWLMNKPLTLFFQVFDTICLFTTVVIVAVGIQDGKSTWLKGVMLIFAYLIIAIAYFVHI